MVAFVGVGRVCVRVCVLELILNIFNQYTTAGTE